VNLEKVKARSKATRNSLRS